MNKKTRQMLSASHDDLEEILEKYQHLQNEFYEEQTKRIAFERQFHKTALELSKRMNYFMDQYTEIALLFKPDEKEDESDVAWQDFKTSYTLFKEFEKMLMVHDSNFFTEGLTKQ